LKIQKIAMNKESGVGKSTSTVWAVSIFLAEKSTTPV
jgi:hypothetical protein